MQISNTKKGYAFIEILISLSLLVIFFVSALNIYIYAMKIKKYNKEEVKRANFILALKHHILLNETYEELSKIKELNSILIEDKAMDIEKLASGKSVTKFISDQVDMEKPYVLVKCQGEEIIKITVKYFEKQGKEKLCFIIYKGKSKI